MLSYERGIVFVICRGIFFCVHEPCKAATKCHAILIQLFNSTLVEYSPGSGEQVDILVLR